MTLNKRCKSLWFFSGLCGIAAELRLLEKGRAQRREEGKDEYIFHIASLLCFSKMSLSIVCQMIH